MEIRPLSHSLGVFGLGCLVFLLGCEGEQIRTYEAPKMKLMERPATSDVRSAPAEPTRMLAAMLPQGEQMWFFKLTAPPEQAVEVREAFAKFVASTRFEGGTPTWEIPSDWEEEPGRPMRFTTYRIGPGGPEVSISSLPARDDQVQYELENVNRWRGQLGLPPLDKPAYTDRKLPESDGEIVSISTPAGTAILIDMVGRMAPSGGGPPFAGPMAGSGTGFGSASSGGGSDAPQFTAPEHWKPGKINSFRVAAFEVERDGESAEITVSTAGGNPLDNINRWRQQVDLEPWTVEELQSELKLLTVDGEAAGYVDLAGPVTTILGAIHRVGGQSWFVKLTGPNRIAAEERTHFETFVESLKF